MVSGSAEVRPCAEDEAAATALPSLHLGRIPVLFENDKENIIVNPTVC